MSQGILYEDDVIQIGLKNEHTPGTLCCDVYLLNKTMVRNKKNHGTSTKKNTDVFVYFFNFVFKAPFMAMRSLIPPVTYLSCQGVDPPAQVPPSSQVRLQLIYRCDYPFESFPDFQVQKRKKKITKNLQNGTGFMGI